MVATVEEADAAIGSDRSRRRAPLTMMSTSWDNCMISELPSPNENTLLGGCGVRSTVFSTSGSTRSIFSTSTVSSTIIN
ncbi:hypothetical protein E2562_031427 [Oryza meyeriana var. granulata]|uniref:Uncharacterized protein n=1 Tax=Oryza meyeriana var. granulata TaxID=110450 RepID=A0A6G1C154_9ORYZ|nr:hypothetical protein E2562_031427 [Oryza meyeriana var. granulata]